MINEFRPAGFFGLRSPLLPFDTLLEWGSGLLNPAFETSSAVTRHEWLEHVDLLRLRLVSIWDRPEIRQAIYLATPSLHEGIKAWLSNPESKKGIQAERSFVRYLQRMSARSTPFGLFSGCSIGYCREEETNLRFSSLDTYKSSTNLDYELLGRLCSELRSRSGVAEHLLYKPAFSLYQWKEVFRYHEILQVGSHQVQQYAEIESDVYLRSVLTRAKDGAGIDVLCDLLVEIGRDNSIQEDDARGYIRELIENGVLVSQFYPLVTGMSALLDLIAQLKPILTEEDTIAVLTSVHEKLVLSDAFGIGLSPSLYQSIDEAFGQLQIFVNPGKSVHVDLIKPTLSAVISPIVFEELNRGIKSLALLMPVGEPVALPSFVARYESRFGQAFVPLLYALDEEHGIGFDSNRFANSAEHEQGMRATKLTRAAAASSALLSDLLSGMSPDQYVLEVSHAHLESRLPPSNSVLSDSAAALVTISAKSCTDVDKGDFELYLQYASAPGGGRFLGRFCEADDELANCVRECARLEAEHYSEALYAEIVHLPPGRMGNVVARPVLRGFEIPCNGRSGAPVTRQITLDDLWVTVRNQRIYLYSKRHGRQIIPRMSSAHNFSLSSSAPIYRFLCMLQQHNATPVPRFAWGPLDKTAFLPRLTVGKVVLSLARWIITREEILTLRSQDRYLCFEAAQRLRTNRSLPRWACLVEGDSFLPIDFNNALSIDAFVHVVNRNTEAVLTELFPPPQQLCVTGPEGRYCHELSIPLLSTGLRDSEPAPAGLLNSFVQHHSAYELRKNPPGSDWLYLKLYGGPSVLDGLLRGELKLLIYNLMQDPRLTRWFFIRYQDPDHHLRIRFHVASSEQVPTILPQLLNDVNRLIKKGDLWKLQIDTYEREVERYGGTECIESTEALFHSDSEAVLQLLELCTPGIAPDERLPMVILGASIQLTDFGLDAYAVRSFADRMRQRFFRELAFGEKDKRAVAKHYRDHRKEYSIVLDASSPNFNAGMTRILKERSVRSMEPLQKLMTLEQQGVLTATLLDIAGSHIHMNVNRLFSESARYYELVMYDHLYRDYDSKISRTIAETGASEHTPNWVVSARP